MKILATDFLTLINNLETGSFENWASKRVLEIVKEARNLKPEALQLIDRKNMRVELKGPMSVELFCVGFGAIMCIILGVGRALQPAYFILAAAFVIVSIVVAVPAALIVRKYHLGLIDAPEDVIRLLRHWNVVSGYSELVHSQKTPHDIRSTAFAKLHKLAGKMIGLNTMSRVGTEQEGEDANLQTRLYDDLVKSAEAEFSTLHEALHWMDVVEKDKSLFVGRASAQQQPE
jgi:hypothetical protein